MPSSAIPFTAVNTKGGPVQQGGGGGGSANASLVAHVTDPTDAHLASAIGYSGGAAWADGTANPAATAEAQFDKIVTDLGAGDGAGKIQYNGGPAWADATPNPAATLGAQADKLISDLVSTTGSSGAHKIGSREIANTTITVAGGTLFSQLQTISNATGIDYVRTGTWADATFLTNGSVKAAIDQVVTTLASSTGPDSGTRKVGSESIVNPSATITGGTLLSQLTLLSRAENLHYNAGPLWLGGRTNPSATVQAQINKIVTDLGVATAGDDGAERIGSEPRASSPSSLATTSVSGQLTELLVLVNDRARIASPETISGNWVHSGTVIHNANVTFNTGITIDEDDNPIWDAVRTVTVAVPRRFISVNQQQDASTWWSYDANGQPEQQISTTQTAIFPVHMMPAGVTITSVSVTIDPAGGHGSLPGTMPSVTLYGYYPAVVRDTLGSQVDTSASVGAYEAPHTITLSGLSYFSPPASFEIAVRGESGSDFVAGLLIRAIQITYTTTVVNLTLGPT